MNKNAKLVTVIATGFAIVAVAFAVYFYSTADNYKTQMEYNNQRAFSELVTSISKLDTAAKKTVYATTPKYATSLFAEIWKEAESAKSSLSQLPTYEIDMSKTQEFVAKIGDFSFAMLKKTANGEALESTDIANLASLSNTAENLSTELISMKQMYNSGNMKEYFGEVKTFEGDTVVNVSSTLENKNNQNAEADSAAQEFATMIYDGPFSSHIDKIEPELTKNQKEYTADEAKEKAAEFLKVSAESIEYRATVNGQIPFYKYTVKIDDYDVAIDVTVKGAHIINYTNYRKIGEQTLDAESAVKKAEELLSRNGFSNFYKTYYIEEDGIVTINFAFTQNDIVMYPDLIKISVFKDDGTLAGVEARGYIMSHRERSDLVFEKTIDEARLVVSSELTILDEGKALIPSAGKYEILTYEFKCKGKDDRNYIVYVNAKTAQIENILILIEDENGTLAM